MPYSSRFNIRMEQVTPARKLRVSELLLLAQQAAVSHIDSLGLDHSKTLDRGYLWVIARQHFVIEKLPSYPEEIEFQTHPGKLMAFIYPRHYWVAQGDKKIIRGVAAWSLIDMNSRKVVTPNQSGVLVPEEPEEGDLPFPSGLRAPELPNQVTLKANWSLCDINGHLNNTKYLDLCEDLIPSGFLHSHEVKELWCDYKKEIKLGEEFVLSYGQIDDSYWFTSDRFVIRIRY